MFEDSPPIDLGRGKNAPAGAKAAPFVWKSLPISDLILYRDQITECLPAITLSETNLEQELLLQLHAVRALQNDVIGDDDIPPNQRAQVANSVAGILNKLVDMQKAVQTQERFKAIESLMVKHLQRLPEETAEAFLKEYRALLEDLK